MEKDPKICDPQPYVETRPYMKGRKKVKKTFVKGTFDGYVTTENTKPTMRQAHFVKLMVEHEHMTQTEAARLAGYKDPGQVGYELMRKPHLAKMMREQKAEYAQLSAMTKQKVMNGYLDAIDQAKKLADPTAQIQGWNSIAKMCGFFEPIKHRIDINVKGQQLVTKLQSMSDEELLNLATSAEAAEALEAEYIDVTHSTKPKSLAPPPSNPTTSNAHEKLVKRITNSPVDIDTGPDADGI